MHYLVGLHGTGILTSGNPTVALECSFEFMDERAERGMVLAKQPHDLLGQNTTVTSLR